MQGIIEFVIGYLILLVVWFLFTGVLYLISLLFKKNFANIALGINMLIVWGIQLYLFGYAIYILWQLISNQEWGLLVLALIFGGFILGLWQWTYELLLFPFNMISALFVGVAQDKIDKHNSEKFIEELVENEHENSLPAQIFAEEIKPEHKSHTDNEYCYNCGKENHKDSNFCKHCGANLKKHESKNKPGYFDRLFSGRLNIRNFIVGNFLLFLWTLAVLFMDIIIQALIDPNSPGEVSTLGVSIMFITYTLYQYSLIIRRLHDQNHSGWFSLISLIPLVNIIFGLYILLVLGDKEHNKYGKQPRAEVSIKDISAF